MQLDLLKPLMFASKRVFHIFLIQLIAMQLLIADPVRSQGMLEDTRISVSITNATLEEVFLVIEEETAFTFSYGNAVIKEDKTFAFHFKEGDLKTLLSEIAQVSGFNFHRVNNIIYVIPRKKKEKISVVEEFAERNIQGSVLDAASGEPLIGATVQVKGTSTGTITDIDGRFFLTVADGAEILVVSFIGYETYEEPIRNKTVFDFTLSPSTSSLSEVIVVGYGTQEKLNLTGSVSSIKSEDVENRPITQASQALSGLVPGVFINTNSGEPGNDQANIRIRGIGTLNNSNPLVLVDGIEAPINSVNPNDIESINILKDAASASIYGSRAANGVVLITTKRGSYEESSSISYDGYFGISNPTVLPDMVWDNRTYLELYREGAINSNRNFNFDDSDIERYDQLPSTNWMEKMTSKNAPVTNHNLSFMGGTSNLRYYFSLGLLDQTSFLADRTNFRRYSSRLNLDAKISEKVRSGFSLAYVSEGGSLTPKDGGGGRSFNNKGSLVMSGAMIQHPIVPVYDQFGRYGSLEAALGIERNRPNSQGVIDNETSDLQGNDFLGNAFLEYEPIDGLKFKGTIGANFQQEIIEDIKREYITYDPITGDPWGNGNGHLNVGSLFQLQQNNSLNLTSWLQSSYERDFGLHNLQLLVGFNNESADIKNYFVDERDYGSKSLVSLGNGTRITTNSTVGEWTLASFFGRLKYNYGGKYLMEFNLRRDGSSRFGSNSRWANFPSISAGWILSEESFIGSGFVSFLKLRGSWGKLGNQSSRLYPFASQVGLGADYTDNSGAALQILGNPDLKWEETTTVDIGLDLNLWEDRINIVADYFLKKTNDILTDLPNPLTSGISSSTTVNAASMENEGFEGMVNFTNHFGDLRIDLGFNVTYVTNKITAINPELADDQDKIQMDREDNVWIIRGESLNAIYGHKVAGIFQSIEEIQNAPDHSFIGTPEPGDFRYTDKNGDGVINEEDQQVIGNRQPKWLYGGTFGANYKGFSFSALFQGIGDADVYISRMYGPFSFAGIRSFWKDRWTPENPSDEIPRLWIDRQGYNGRSIATADQQNSFWVQNRSYLRLKNIQLGYTFPESLLANSFFKSVRIYINGQNLWTKTALKDLDPERFSTESHATNVLPQSKIYSIGLNAKF